MTTARDINFDIRGRDRTQSAFDSAGRNARGFQGQLDNIQRGMNMAGMAARAFAGAFAVTAISNFGRVVREVVTEAADLVDLADKVGVTTEELQRMIYGFGLAGVQASDVDQILSQWSKRIGEAHTSGGRLADILAANGVALTDSEGRLRSSVDLMRDYANLIAGASSDQERMTLATEAFGRAGGSMVLALRDGADGMDQLMRSADKAGGVLEDDILRRAADIDDAFNDLWRNFEISAKSAILQSVSWLSGLRDDIRSILAPQSEAQRAGDLGAYVGGLTTQGSSGKQDRPVNTADSRIADAFQVADYERNEALARQLRDRYGPKTIIPDTDEDKRKGSGRAASSQADALDRVNAALDHELRLIGLSETEQRILNEQRRAGVDATSAEGRAIEEKVRRIDAEREAQERLEEQQKRMQEAAQYLGDLSFDAMWSIVESSATAEEALKRLVMEFARAAAYAALFGGGPLGGLFGGSNGGGLFGGLFGGNRAEGGPVDPWKTYVVGERGPELIQLGPQGGRVVSNDNAFGGAGGGVQEVRVYVDQDGNWQAAVERIATGPANRAAAHVAKRVPAMVASEKGNEWRKLRPTGTV